ncbi:sulfite oxidase [Galbibacter sp. BG1]|uniref:sulfite oxidase n=1 Tax=Galbibacter sp. BG1 TaxID=1170699 RepID=UPI0015BDFAFB|nr:sulfite oxidase [Galbibacter sp. BG1]QLE03007.1 sulfite oxidase [Galbibacter sp. BG1]
MKRRKFIESSLFTSAALASGVSNVYGHLMPKGYVPLLAQDPNPFELFNLNEEMEVLNDRPWNIESKAHLLNDAITPNSAMFIRNNGLLPESIDATTWTLTVEGESAAKTKTYTLTDLKKNFKQYSYQLTLECGGNGRKEFYPPAKGNQWGLGAVHCAKWTGVRLKDVLEDVGIKKNAVYIGYHAADIHLSRSPDKEPISRGCPMHKAMEDETLLAFKMNDEEIPIAHGYPLRLVAGGWPASVSGKWLQTISVRNKVHDGAKMTGTSYRVPCKPVAPGEEVADEDMCIIESMPVKSLITSPKTGAMLKLGKPLKINGHAWAGDLEVVKMEYSIDFGSTWHQCELKAPANRLAWQQFTATVNFPETGYYEVWARATDSNGKSQPMVLPGWNPKGYLNNACHRIAIKVS